MSIEAENVEHEIETEDLQLEILRTLKLILLHLQSMSDEEFDKGDLDERSD